jgi:ParB-like chromosome segregation protein Spo0J
MELRRLPIDQLKPAPYNPRGELRPGSPAYRKLAASLREFGLVEPLVWNELTGHVVGGHARLRILRELGTTEVPVSVVRLSPEREKALNIVLNKREAQGRYHPAKLAELLGELQGLPEFDLTGFSRNDLATLRFEPLPDLEPLAEPEDVEMTIVVSRSDYDRVAPRLDELIRDLDLVCHVKGLLRRPERS